MSRTAMVLTLTMGIAPSALAGKQTDVVALLKRDGAECQSEEVVGKPAHSMCVAAGT